jgi:hypothetical protein
VSVLKCGMASQREWLWNERVGSGDSIGRLKFDCSHADHRFSTTPTDTKQPLHV